MKLVTQAVCVSMFISICVHEFTWFLLVDVRFWWLWRSTSFTEAVAQRITRPAMDWQRGGQMRVGWKGGLRLGQASLKSSERQRNRCCCTRREQRGEIEKEKMFAISWPSAAAPAAWPSTSNNACQLQPADKPTDAVSADVPADMAVDSPEEAELISWMFNGWYMCVAMRHMVLLCLCCCLCFIEVNVCLGKALLWLCQL